MNLKDVIEKRASVRRFTDAAVPVDDLKEMVRRAGLSPSINNSQPWKFLVVNDNAVMDELASIIEEKLDKLFPDEKFTDKQNIKKKVKHFSTIFTDAPAVVVVLTKPYKAVVDDMLGESELSHDDINAMRNVPNIQSLGAAVQSFLLSAVDLGYGACWMTGPLVAREELEARLGVKEPYSIGTFITVGKPADEHHQKEKKPVDEIFEVVT